MLKYIFAFFTMTTFYAQEGINSEVFLFDLSLENESFKISNGKNISKNPGYDNQPSFYNSDTILYSGTRNGQTDIVGYHIISAERFWLSNTEQGSEYSPQKIAGSKDVAAVRLDTTGLQRLYRYDGEARETGELLKDLKVGYFFYFNETTLVTAVLSGTGMDLVINDLQEGTSNVLMKNIGRSIHKIPSSNSISYTITNEENAHDLYLLDLQKEEPESFYLCTLPSEVLDYAWVDQNRIILGNGSKIYSYDMLGEGKWTPIKDLSKYGIKNITRIAISEGGNKMTLVAEVDSK